MQNTTREILLRHPAYTLELLKNWSETGEPRHAFMMHPAIEGRRNAHQEGVNLMMGEGHDVSRRDMHYAIYLFQKFHMTQPEIAQAGNS
ncbi:MAG: hypothetical protein MK052_04425 [Alphaproteobacteria bacterium]|nr:hypothetical protein [Alphaproteobacteria bacterium]